MMMTATGARVLFAIAALLGAFTSASTAAQTAPPPFAEHTVRRTAARRTLTREADMDPRNYDVPGAIAVNALFVTLLAVGTFLRGLRLRVTAALILLWVAAYVGLPYVSFGGLVYGPFLFVAVVALLDLLAMGLMLRGFDRLE